MPGPHKKLKPPNYKPVTNVAKIDPKKRSKAAKRKLRGPYPTRPKGLGNMANERKYGLSFFFDSEGKYKDDY